MIVFACLYGCNNDKKEDATSEVNKPAEATTMAVPPNELLDSSAAIPVKKAMEAFEKGDIDGYLADYMDDARLNFSGGDSLIGKAAIKNYYVGRWKLLQTLKFSNHIFLPIKANVSPNGVIPAGKWMLSWAQVDATYKNGKSVRFWVHNANHFNDAGKIDLASQYIDRLPLMEATKGMK